MEFVDERCSVNFLCGWTSRVVVQRIIDHLRKDQSPRFGTHVIHRLTVKFNHHRVKVYHLHVFCLAKVESRLVHRFLCSAAVAHTEACTDKRERESERGTIQIRRFRQRLNGRIYIHTKLC